MKKVLLHTCCAPCSVSCTQPLLQEGVELTAFWYNPNIHPFKEYEARRDCFVEYMNSLNIPFVLKENYGLREFVKNVADDIDSRCIYCYEHRLEETAKMASDNGFDAFTSTLFASIYQNHDMMKSAAERFAKKYGVDMPIVRAACAVLYEDFPADQVVERLLHRSKKPEPEEIRWN